MVLTRYLTRRYLAFFIVINLSLALLYNLIEFFEKMSRIHHGRWYQIIYFIGLNLIPSFFDAMGQSSWLTTVLLIKDGDQHHEWNTLRILGFPFFSLARIMMICAMFVGVTHIIGKECLVPYFAQHAHNYNLTTFKQQRTHVLNHHLHLVAPNTFAYEDEIDLQKGMCSSVWVISCAPDGTPHQLIQGASCTIDGSGKIFHFPLAYTTTLTPLPHTTSPASYELHNIEQQGMTSHVMDSAFMQRMLNHCVVILYPLITLLFFWQLPPLRTASWLNTLLPYPLITLGNAICSWLSRIFMQWWLLFLPHLGLAAISIALIIRQRRSA